MSTQLAFRVVTRFEKAATIASLIGDAVLRAGASLARLEAVSFALAHLACALNQSSPGVAARFLVLLEGREVLDDSMTPEQWSALPIAKRFALLETAYAWRSAVSR